MPAYVDVDFLNFKTAVMFNHYCRKLIFHYYFRTGISPLSIVTAMVDEVRIHRDQIDVTHDIIMEGHVTWSGRSSLEIGMLLTQEKQPVMGAQFVMVARDAARKK